MYEITVEHEMHAGHRIVGHTNPDGTAGKCARIHGHTYGFIVTLAGDLLDDVGFVVDFSVVKAIINEWDHRTLLWQDDPLTVDAAAGSTPGYNPDEQRAEQEDEAGIVRVPFNPTAENMAEHLTRRILRIGGLLVVAVEVRETAKTHATFRMTARDLQHEAGRLRDGHHRAMAMEQQRAAERA